MEHEVQVEVSIGGETVSVTATVEVDGEYRPATWGFDGGNPPEYPEADIVSVVRQDTGATVAVEDLSDRDRERIEEAALRLHDDDDDDPGLDDDPGYDDHDLSY